MSKEYDRDWWTTEAMMRYGGSFVSGLGSLWRLGDPGNRAKLKKAFKDYWGDYVVTGQRLEEEDVV